MRRVKEPIDCVVIDLFVENVRWELELCRASPVLA